MKKLKRVSNSKEPTVKQMETMSSNLCLHTQGYVNISISTRSHPGSEVKISYGIYVACDSEATHEFPTWPEAISFYRSLMKKGPENV